MEPLARLTAATVDVLGVLLAEPSEAGGVWGMQVIKRTGRPAGSVYPILERLEGAGWVASCWESSSERRGPRRRFYELTGDGRAAAVAAVEDWSTPRGRPRRRRVAAGAAGVVIA